MAHILRESIDKSNEPDYADVVAEEKVGLQLSGQSHGGGLVQSPVRFNCPLEVIVLKLVREA